MEPPMYSPETGQKAAIKAIIQKQTENYRKQDERLELRELLLPELYEQLRSYHERLRASSDDITIKAFEKQIAKTTDKIEGYKIQPKAVYAAYIKHIIEATYTYGYGVAKDNHTGVLLLYDGIVWSEISEQDMIRYIYDYLRASGIDTNNGLDDESCKAKFARQLQWEVDTLTQAEHKEVSTINFVNGTYELGLTKETSRFREHRRSDGLRIVLPYQYNPDATITYFNRTLDLFLPEPDKQALLYEYLGYVFHRKSDLFNQEVMLILYGPEGRNGKSTIMKTCLALYGRQNVMSATLTQLCSRNSYYTPELQHKLLNVCGETDAKDIDQELLRALVSGESVWVRPIYGKGFEMTDYARFMFIVNNLPDIEPDKATERRIKTIVFDKSLEEGQTDTGYADKIVANDLSGIFNQAIEHFWTLVERNRFTEPTSSRDEIEGWLRDQCTITDFVVSEGYNPNAPRIIENFIPTNDLYDEYNNWCESKGIAYRKGKNTFSKRFRQNRFKADTIKRQRGYYATKDAPVIDFNPDEVEAPF